MSLSLRRTCSEESTWDSLSHFNTSMYRRACSLQGVRPCSASSWSYTQGVGEEKGKEREGVGRKGGVRERGNRGKGSKVCAYSGTTYVCTAERLAKTSAQTVLYIHMYVTTATFNLYRTDTCTQEFVNTPQKTVQLSTAQCGTPPVSHCTSARSSFVPGHCPRGHRVH